MSPPSPYISWIGHGAVSLAQPAHFSDVQAYAFVLEAKTEAMQKLVDQLLGPVADEALSYTVISPFCVVSFMAMAQCRSLADNIGWLPGHETAWWIPLLEVDRRTNGMRLVMWSPYIFIDYTIGMLTGREVWGWSKSLAAIRMPSLEAGPWTLACETTTFRTLSPDTRGQDEVLFQVSGEQAVTAHDWHDLTVVGSAAKLLDHLFPGVARTLAKGWHLGPLAAIALKQFRDPAQPRDSCYQAIVESPVEFAPIRGFGFLRGGDMRLSVTHCESHQIVQDFFGTQPPPDQLSSTFTPLFALWMRCDFTALDGRVLVQS